MDARTNYYLLLADIRDSTGLPPKKAKAVFTSIETALADLNRKLKPTLKLTVSYGDEIAGIFSDPADLYKVVTTIRDILRMCGVEFRVVITYGKIGVVSPDIRKVGGPVFKYANDEILDLKRHGRFSRWRIPGADAGDTLDSLVNMSNALITQMTDYQYDVFNLLRQGLSQKEIAKRLKKYPQSVSDAVRRGQIDLVIDAETVIENYLTGMRRK